MKKYFQAWTFYLKIMACALAFYAFHEIGVFPPFPADVGIFAPQHPRKQAAHQPFYHETIVKIPTKGYVVQPLQVLLLHILIRKLQCRSG